MKLSLFHGRSDPGQDVNMRGFDGPVLLGVAWFRMIYSGQIWLIFDSEDEREAAHDLVDPCRLLTDHWVVDKTILSLGITDGMIPCSVPGVGDMWFGEFEIEEE